MVSPGRELSSVAQRGVCVCVLQVQGLGCCLLPQTSLTSRSFPDSGRFLGCGRVCGDRSVFVTSHRPAHISRAYASSLFKLCISHLKWFCLLACLHGPACLFLITPLRVSILATLLRVIAYNLNKFVCVTLASSGPQGPLDSFNSHTGLS